MVEANLAAIEAPKEALGKAFNIACGGNFTLLQLLALLEDILGKKINRVFQEPQPGDVKHSLADISRARKLLSYHPKVGFREGLERTIEWFSRRLKG